eukprot:15341473-Ditylum_brightwellii.AAC.1
MVGEEKKTRQSTDTAFSHYLKDGSRKHHHNIALAHDHRSGDNSAIGRRIRTIIGCPSHHR